MDAMERVRQRLRRLIGEHLPQGKVLQNRLAKHVGEATKKGEPMSDAWISNILGKAKKGLRLEYLDAVAEFLHMTPAELVRHEDDDLVEVTPTEKALLRKFRHLDRHGRNAVFTVLGMQSYLEDPPATPIASIPKRPKNPPKK